ncbi:MAG: T9SS type A sorting domain-containing protein [Rhodothermales bacterium]
MYLDIIISGPAFRRIRSLPRASFFFSLFLLAPALACAQSADDRASGQWDTRFFSREVGDLFGVLWDRQGNIYAQGGYSDLAGLPSRGVVGYDGNEWFTFSDDDILPKWQGWNGDIYGASEIINNDSGNEKQILSRLDGDEWATVATLPEQFDDLLFDNSGNVFAVRCAANGSPYTLGVIALLQGSTWNDVGTTRACFEDFVIGADGHLYRYMSPKSVERYDLTSGTWTQASPTIDSTYQTLTEYAVDRAGTVYATLYSNGMRVAKSNGDKWEFIEPEEPAYYSMPLIDGLNRLYVVKNGDFEPEVLMYKDPVWSSLGPPFDGKVRKFAADSEGNLYLAGGFIDEQSGGQNLAVFQSGTWELPMPVGRGSDRRTTPVIFASSNRNIVATSGVAGYAPLAVWADDHWVVPWPHLGYYFNVVAPIGDNTYLVDTETGYLEWNTVTTSPQLSPCQLGNAGRFSRTWAINWNGTGDVYVSGTCDANGTDYGVYHWSNGTWHRIGAFDGSVEAIGVGTGSEVFVAGSFTAVDGLDARGLAVYQNGAWSAIGPGISAGRINKLLWHEGSLFAAGAFSVIADTTGHALATWTDGTWRELGSLDGEVYSIAIDKTGMLYAAGLFRHDGNNPLTFVAQWSGSEWLGLGGGAAGPAFRVVVDGDNTVWFAGDFAFVDGIPSSKLARWIPSSSTSTGQTHGHAFRFLDAYPNPFIDRFAFSIFTDHFASGEIALHNLLGQRVASLGTLGVAGGVTRTIQFSVPDLPSGIYLLTMTSDGRKISRKVVHVRQ